MGNCKAAVTPFELGNNFKLNKSENQELYKKLPYRELIGALM